MRKFHLKTSLALLLTGIIIGVCSSLLFNGCHGGNNNIANYEITQPKELRDQVVATETNYQAKINELENKNHVLQQELKTTKTQLAEVKVKTKQRQSRIKELIAPKGLLAKDLIQRTNSSSTNIDSSLSPCDSLANEVNQYLVENFKKDSLYEIQVVMQDSLIAAKDSIITLNDERYCDLKKILTQSLIQQETLIIDNKLLQKKFKSQKFRNKLVVLGTMIVSGVITNYLIHD